MQDERTLNVQDEQAAAVSPADVDVEEPLDDESDGEGYECKPYLISADITGFVNQYPNDPVPTWGKHRMRQADEREYESFLSMMPSRRITAGKGRGGNASSRNLPTNEARAATRLYNIIAKTVGGYEFDEAIRLPDGRPFGTGGIMDDVDVQQEVMIKGATEDDLRRLLNLPERAPVPATLRVYDLIPTTDKAAALAALAAGTVERKRAPGRAKRLGAVGVRTWTFLHKIGAARNADGQLSPPVHQIEYDFEEWEEKTFRRMKEKAYTTTHTPLNGGGHESTTITHLRVIIETFDKTIREVRGAVLAIPREGAQEGDAARFDYIPVDVRRPDHLRAIPPAFKLGAATRMYLDTEAEAKN